MMQAWFIGTRAVNRLTIIWLSAILTLPMTATAFGWGAVSGPHGGAAYRGPMGGAAVRGPYGGAAARGPAGGVAARGPYGGAAYRGPYGGTAVRGAYGGDHRCCWWRLPALLRGWCRCGGGRSWGGCRSRPSSECRFEL